MLEVQEGLLELARLDAILRHVVLRCTQKVLGWIEVMQQSFVISQQATVTSLGQVQLELQVMALISKESVLITAATAVAEVLKDQVSKVSYRTLYDFADWYLEH